MDALLQDVRYAIRSLRKAPGFSVAALLTLAMGIGATTAVFSVVNSVLLRPFPYPDPDRIVLLMSTLRGHASSLGVSSPRFTVWRQSVTAFQDVAAYQFGGAMTLTNRDRAERITVGRVSADFFRLFGARVAQGRSFTAEEDRPQGARVAVLSAGFWRRQLGADAHVVGQMLSLDGEPYVVLGILEPGFQAESLSPFVGAPPDVWLPLQVDPHSTSDAFIYIAAARLRSGITLGAAQAQTQLATAAFRRAFPGIMPPDAGLTVETLQTVLVADVRPSLLLLLGAVEFILLMVCANTANLLLVRASVRHREMAIRSATGASRGRIARQLLTESLVLSGAGGTLGLLCGLIGIRALLAIDAANIPRIVRDRSSATMDWRVLLFTLISSVAVGVAFGVLPAVQASHVDLDAALKAGGDRGGAGRHNRARALLIVSEVALALILLVSSALLIRSFVALRRVNPGFDAHDMLTMRMAVTGRRFATTARTADLVRDGVQRVSAVPGVEVAAATLTGLPLEGGAFLSADVVGRPLDGQFYAAGWHLVTPAYFDVFKIPLVRGRPLTDRDTRGSPPVVLINEAMARRFWPDGDPLNDRLLIGRGAGAQLEERVPRQIVGIVGDIRYQGLDRDPRPTTYVPLAQAPDDQVAFLNRLLGSITWVVRTRGEPHLFADPIQHELHEATGGLPIDQIRSMDEVSAASTSSSQVGAWLMTMFGCSALLLAAIGVYGVVAYAVQRRTHEIGIRLALGAQAHQVRRMVLVRCVALTLLGVGIGIVSALGLTRVIASVLFGVTARDPLVFAAVPLLLIAVAFLAAWLPAQRAARVDPIVALRAE
jgi:putative ABC transport system permease protein